MSERGRTETQYREETDNIGRTAHCKSGREREERKRHEEERQIGTERKRIEKGKRHQEEGQQTGRHRDEN
jgi:hypothetical protein